MKRTFSAYYLLFGFVPLLIILAILLFNQSNQTNRSPIGLENTYTSSPTPTLFKSRAAVEPTITPTKTPTVVESQTQTPARKLPVLNGGNIFSLVNTYRSSMGKPFLSVSSELCALAEARADYMMANNMAAFKSSEAGGHTGFEGITNQYSGNGVGENLAANSSTDAGVLELWKNSPIHNEGMLRTERDGVPITKGCVATRVSVVGSITVLLWGDK